MTHNLSGDLGHSACSAAGCRCALHLLEYMRQTARCLMLVVPGALLWPGAVLAADNCQLQISNQTIDYGQMTRAELLARKVSPATFSLGKQSMTLTATCRKPALITLFFRGAAADDVSYRFGYGGNFTLQLSNAHLDGKAVNLGQVKVADQMPEIMRAAIALTPNYGAVPVSNEWPLRGSSLSMNVEIEARVSAVGSRVADQTVWRGNGNFELREN